MRYSAATGAVTFARGKGIVTDDAAKAVSGDDVGLEFIDFVDETASQLSLEIRFLIPLRHHAGMPAVGGFRNRFRPVE
jgi:hypothetical protein